MVTGHTLIKIFSTFLFKYIAKNRENGIIVIIETSISPLNF